MRIRILLVSAQLGLLACSNDASSPPDLATGPRINVTTGIPFGLFGFAPGDYSPNTRPDTFWTSGAVTDKGLNHVKNQLAIAQTNGLRFWYNVTSPDEADYYKGGTGADAHDFSLSKWKDTFDLYACPCNANGTSQVSLATYINNGTLVGTWLLDDMAHFTNNTPKFADLEAIAAHAKMRFPGITTAVRQRPTELEKLTNVGTGTKKFLQLDVAWAQYNSRQEDVDDYVLHQNQAATRHGLKMIYGINVTDGGDNNGAEVSLTQLADWGDAMLSNAQTCSFIMWNDTYSASKLNSSQMLALSNQAKAHATTSCH